MDNGCLLYAFIIVRLDRRELVWIKFTRNLTAQWVARLTTKAFPWKEAPGYMIRVCDRIYGGIVTRRLHAAFGTSYCTSLALAEWICRTADRINPPRMPGPYHGFWQGTSEPCDPRALLQRRQNASILG
jgi:hypothetical protein